MKAFDTASSITGIGVVEGKFTWSQLSGSSPEIELVVVYLDAKSGATYGTCKVTNSLMKPATLDTFRDFIKFAEDDFSEIVAEGRKEVGTLEHQMPEKETGLPKGLGNI